MSNRVCPCKGCVPPKRTLSCHSTCQEYTDWKTDLEALNDKIRESKKEYADFIPAKLKRKRGLM